MNNDSIWNDRVILRFLDTNYFSSAECNITMQMIENNYDASNVLAMSVVAKMIVNDEYY